MGNERRIVQVCLDVPLVATFDFRVPEGLDPEVGNLVVVPFGRTRKVGVVTGRIARSEIAPEKLRDIESVVADVAPLGRDELDLYRFCANYYLRPLGEVIAASLPPRLRQARRRKLAPAAPATARGPIAEGPPPTAEQEAALATVLASFDRFHPVLLEGITGSGKTEVYLRAIAEALARGRQALYLVPEIGLTPQLESRVRGRFPGEAVIAAHSHRSEGERAQAWLAAQSGTARIVLGTRLAVLSPFADLGLIIVDEEHDASYKQQEGLRYSARDVAVRRAQSLGIPVILGSATPSLESYTNARDKRYAHAKLAQRATGAALPVVRMIDTRVDKPVDGISRAMRDAVAARLERGEQSLIFVNRRGFAPVLYCRDCAWHSTCKRCSANLVLHLNSGEMRCHHCGFLGRVPPRCPKCGGMDLAPVGQGTQRVEESLQALFPKARIARVDRDSTARKGALKEVLDRVHASEVDILVGTQMLAKGHDYPGLTLVVALDSDSALFSADFRASERLFAQLVQVGGRAGRAALAGEVLIQTDFPTHPLYAAVARNDFAAFAEETLTERRAAGFPPYAHLALLRAESKKAGEAEEFLESAARLAKRFASRVEIFDPVPARMARKAGFERAQLLVRAKSRAALQPFLREWKSALDAKAERRVRWTLDVDPQEL
ncbi:primosomal protein N' [Usitatibacter palustris]|uniref:Replication restart protein PriA n=1 Tax=Usitatibacter palustris TaxID=2732487 RepID=A0A6M4HBF3_9PROT|nr:primosomal protein N' [Usitatibacter palustris]QJR16926.1 Primosomal protein N' [Usitatibacter palustris]